MQVWLYQKEICHQPITCLRSNHIPC